MAITAEFTKTVETDLRTSGGHSLIVAELTTFAGTYDEGGVMITPEMFGLETIDYISIQENVAVPDTEIAGSGDGWSLIISFALMAYQGQWHLITLQGPGIGGDLNELAQDTPIEMNENYSPKILVIGN